MCVHIVGGGDSIICEGKRSASATQTTPPTWQRYLNCHAGGVYSLRIQIIYYDQAVYS